MFVHIASRLDWSISSTVDLALLKIPDVYGAAIFLRSYNQSIDVNTQWEGETLRRVFQFKLQSIPFI